MKNLLMGLLLLVASIGCSAAQTATLTGTENGQTSTATINLVTPSTDTYNFNTASVSGVASGTVSFTVNAATTRLQPAGLQFTISGPAASIASFSFTASATVAAAGKTISCAPVATPPAGLIQSVCLISGGLTSVPNGAIASVVVTLTATPINGTITLSAPVSVNVNGNAINAVVSGTGVAFAIQPTLAINCAADPNTLTPTANTIEKGEILTCTVTLSAVQTAATTVTLTSSATVSPGFTVPANVIVASGTSSTTFQITGI